jgi:hypothetical protein
MRKKILIRGPILSRSGYGEQARFALRSIREYEERFDVFILPTNWGMLSWTWEDTEERRWIDSIIEKTALYETQTRNVNGSENMTSLCRLLYRMSGITIWRHTT